ncbi:MAG: hypothetical protein A4S09_09550 [Proteobacteria bacterium SG_bin7]|nr:MAG: hypothetical protein A4S09_09550 [Proteobacteria bacterium SG_bin7]
MSVRQQVEKDFVQFLEDHSKEVTKALSSMTKEYALKGLPQDFRLPIMPRFFTDLELAQLEQTTNQFLALVRSVPQRIFKNDIEKISVEFGLPELKAKWITDYFPPDFNTIGWARPDAYVWEDNVQFMEQNLTTGIGGFSFVELVNRFFEEHPAILQLRAKYDLQPLSVIEGIRNFFNEPTFRGKQVGYLDAIVPETGRVYDMEGSFLVDELKKRGALIHYFETEHATSKNDKVYFDGKHIEVFLRNFPGDLISARLKDLMPILKSCGARNCFMVETPYDLVLMNKLILAYLSDEKYRHYFSKSESDFLDKVLPWTRRFNSELVSVAEREKNNFVLKKGIGWQGRQVVMGANSSVDDWKGAIANALRDGDWILQKVIEAPLVEMPFLVDGEIKFGEVYQISAPFMFAGKLGGFSCRNSVPGGSKLLAMQGGQTGRTTVYKVGSKT